ncbi:MAG: hypothetical protein IJ643_04465 [Eubacterium sp.]|nr:hypothetical protein [Eubacterium sp.]
MNRYEEMKSRQQKEFNDFPIYFAFGNEQINRVLKELDLNTDRESERYFANHTVSIGYGGFILKKDKDAFTEMLKRHEGETKAAIADDETGEGFIYEMFKSALGDTEYCYDLDYTRAFDALGYSEKEVVNDSRLLAGFKKAKQELDDWRKSDEY